MNLEEKANELAKQEETKGRELAPQQNNGNNEEINLKNLQNEYFKKQVEKGNSLTDISMDFAKANITNEIFSDESEDADKYKKELAKERKDTIKEGFKQDKVAPKTETLNDWIEFDNEILAYEYFGVKNDTNTSTEQLPVQA